MLRSPSAGKLLQYTVDDGGHVAEGNVFAEIEVSFVEELGGALLLQLRDMAKIKPTVVAAVPKAFGSMQALLVW